VAALDHDPRRPTLRKPRKKWSTVADPLAITWSSTSGHAHENSVALPSRNWAGPRMRLARIYLGGWGFAGLVFLDVEELNDGELTDFHRNLQHHSISLRSWPGLARAETHYSFRSLIKAISVVVAFFESVLSRSDTSSRVC
jgi:hypothetical protein